MRLRARSGIEELSYNSDPERKSDLECVSCRAVREAVPKPLRSGASMPNVTPHLSKKK